MGGKRIGTFQTDTVCVFSNKIMVYKCFFLFNLFILNSRILSIRKKILACACIINCCYTCNKEIKTYTYLADICVCVCNIMYLSDMCLEYGI